MALAIASLASKWFRTISINEKQLMEAYGITEKQLSNATKVIMQHYKQRVKQGWAIPPAQINAAVARGQEFDKVIQNLSDALYTRLKEAQLDGVMEDFFGVMSHINEPSVDASTSNVAISMVAGCVMYNVLARKGLHHGNLNAISKAVRRSGAGIKSRLEDFRLRYKNGEFPEADVLFAFDDDGDSSTAEESAEE